LLKFIERNRLKKLTMLMIIFCWCALQP